MISSGLVGLSFPLTYYYQDIKTTRSIIANGTFCEVIPIAAAIIHHPQFAIPYSGII
jgi:TRAP-type mannitol/chloroaromatic compound transport system permease large subunit